MSRNCRGGRGGFNGPGGFAQDLTVAAATIGIPVDQLRTELNGKSLADVAAAHGKTGDAVAGPAADVSKEPPVGGEGEARGGAAVEH